MFFLSKKLISFFVQGILKFLDNTTASLIDHSLFQVIDMCFSAFLQFFFNGFCNASVIVIITDATLGDRAF